MHNRLASLALASLALVAGCSSGSTKKELARLAPAFEKAAATVSAGVKEDLRTLEDDAIPHDQKVLVQVQSCDDAARALAAMGLTEASVGDETVRNALKGWDGAVETLRTVACREGTPKEALDHCATACSVARKQVCAVAGDLVALAAEQDVAFPYLCNPEQSFTPKP